MTSMMKMTKPAKPTPPTLKTTIKRLVLGFLGLIAVILLSYLLVVRPIQIRQNREDFKKAEASLEELSQKIIAQVGAPDQVVRNKDCGYASRAFGNGPRGCGVEVSLVYYNRDAVASTNLMNSVSRFSNEKVITDYGDEGIDEFLPNHKKSFDQSFSQYSGKVGKLRCGINYAYPLVKRIDQKIVSNYLENIVVTLHCGGDALAEFYPVTQ